jgi:[Skp1-protein]-hydroxyproline N-acetylglucosaminyltransferase
LNGNLESSVRSEFRILNSYTFSLSLGVVDQIVDGEDPRCDEPIEPCDKDPEQALCKYKDQVDVYQMEARLSVGPVFARHIGHRMYRGEYYATQSDAHVSFTTNWDSDIIEQMEATHDEMAVLTSYLTDVQGSIDPKTGASLRHTRPIMCNTFYEGGQQGMHLRHGSQPERHPSIHGAPQLQPWWAAGYSFSRGHFVVNVPYDPYQPMIFQGEEMSIGIRGFTIGYDFYAPERSVCFHHYAVGKNAGVRNKVKHFWENGDLYAGYVVLLKRTDPSCTNEYLTFCFCQMYR